MLAVFIFEVGSLLAGECPFSAMYHVFHIERQ